MSSPDLVFFVFAAVGKILKNEADAKNYFETMLYMQTRSFVLVSSTFHLLFERSYVLKI